MKIVETIKSFCVSDEVDRSDHHHNTSISERYVVDGPLFINLFENNWKRQGINSETQKNQGENILLDNEIGEFKTPILIFGVNSEIDSKPQDTLFIDRNDTSETNSSLEDKIGKVILFPIR